MGTKIEKTRGAGSGRKNRQGDRGETRSQAGSHSCLGCVYLTSQSKAEWIRFKPSIGERYRGMDGHTGIQRRRGSRDSFSAYHLLGRRLGKDVFQRPEAEKERSEKEVIYG